MRAKFMRTKFIVSYIALFILMAAAGCTRNDGNIGKQFGQWKLVSITRQGVDEPSYKGNVYWSFQNSTIEIKERTPQNDVWHSFGNYRIADETLFLSFPDEEFPPRQVLGLPRESELQILELTGGRMVLYYEGDTDEGTTYTLHKW